MVIPKNLDLLDDIGDPDTKIVNIAQNILEQVIPFEVDVKDEDEEDIFEGKIIVYGLSENKDLRALFFKNFTQVTYLNLEGKEEVHDGFIHIE